MHNTAAAWKMQERIIPSNAGLATSAKHEVPRAGIMRVSYKRKTARPFFNTRLHQPNPSSVRLRRVHAVFSISAQCDVKHHHEREADGKADRTDIGFIIPRRFGDELFDDDVNHRAGGERKKIRQRGCDDLG